MSKKTKKNIILAIAASTGTISGTMIASHVAIYDKIFSRYERPDYSITPGIVCLDRLDKNIQRKEIAFYSDDVLLKGNYFTCKKPKGIVVIAHGLHSGGDDYLNVASYLLENRYNVFSFNYKGTYDSEGDSTVGMCESLVDLDHAIAYIQNNPIFADLPLFLLGHSWGGFAVSAVLSFKKNIKGCACISAMNDGYNMIIDKGSEYVGKLSATSKPILDVYQKLLFKNYIKYTGEKGINSCSIPVIVAHGVDDKVIAYDKQAVIANKKKITNPNVIYYNGKGLQGEHSSIMFSHEAIIYQKELKSDIALLEMEKGRKLTKDELREFYSKIDHKLYSEVNKPLFDLIIKTFDSSLK